MSDGLYKSLEEATRTDQVNKDLAQMAVEQVGTDIYHFMTFVDPYIIVPFIKKNPNKMQQCIKILLLHIYMKLNMFWASHRPSSGA